MKACQLALLSSFLLAVSAKVKITTPVNGTVWEFGKKNTVNWKHEDSDTGPVDINLIYTAGVDPEQFRGEPVATQPIDDVTKDTAEFDLSKLDKSQFPPSAELYFLRFGDVNGSYSHLFTINGGSGAAVASTSSGSSGSSGSSSSSGSGSSGSSAASTGSSGSSSSNGSTGSSGTTGSNNASTAGSNANGSTAGANANGSTAGASTVPGNSTVAGNTANGANPSATNSTQPNGTLNNVVTGSPVKPANASGAGKSITTSLVAIGVAVAAFLF